MSQQTNKYGKNSPCGGCESISLSTDCEPCVSCRMIKKPSNYQPREKNQYYAILAVDNENEPEEEVLAHGDFTKKEADEWGQFYAKQSDSPTETIYLLKGAEVQIISKQEGKQ